MSKPKVSVAQAIEMVPIDQLKEWEKNPRRNDHVVDALAQSIERYGMNMPLLVNANKQVIAGNTRLKACRKLGLSHVPCLSAKHLTPQQQQAFNVADNKIASLASWDDTLLLEIFDSQKNQLGELFDPGLLGFTDTEYDLLAQGWQSDGALDKVPEDSGEAPARIVVTGPQEYFGAAKEVIANALQNEGLSEHGFQVK